VQQALGDDRIEALGDTAAGAPADQVEIRGQRPSHRQGYDDRNQQRRRPAGAPIAAAEGRNADRDGGQADRQRGHVGIDAGADDRAEQSPIAARAAGQGAIECRQRRHHHQWRQHAAVTDPAERHMPGRERESGRGQRVGLYRRDAEPRQADAAEQRTPAARRQRRRCDRGESRLAEHHRAVGEGGNGDGRHC